MRRCNGPGLIIAVALAIASPAPGLGRTVDGRQHSMPATGGADVIRGDATKDRLSGKSGDDRLYGRGGSDRLDGGAGNDALYGGAGADLLFGGPGADILSGGPGGDRLNGGPGNDRLAGGSGNDRISVRGMGRDRVRCGSGRDTVLADSRDRLSGCETVKRGGPNGSDPCDGVPDCGPGNRGLGLVAGGDPALLPSAGSDPAGPPDPPSAPAPRPNIVFILTDDQPYGTVTPEFMPNVSSSLVEPGLTFSNAFVTRSLCCPSRASILTGQYAHNTGVHGNLWDDGGFPHFNDVSTLATWLKDAGYRTGLIGKYFNLYGQATGYGGKPAGPLYVPPGWDTFRAINSGLGQGSYYDFSLNIDGRETRSYPRYTHEDPDNPTFHPENYVTTALTEHALEFIDASASDDRPFYLYFAPTAPHTPYWPAEEDLQAFPRLPVLHPPSFNEDDVSDKPQWVRETPKWAEWWVDGWRLQQLRTNLAVDRAVGTIVDRLRGLGELDNTMIVFTSDNGLMWGEHRQMNKLAAYEESIRVPLIVRGPGVRQGTASPMVANIDFAPTFAEFAQATPGLTVDGRSLTPLLAGVPAGWRDDLLVEHWMDAWSAGWPPTFKSLRTEDHKYVEYVTGERELYDLRSDPYELQNVAGDPRQAGLVQRLSTRLANLATCAGETCRTDEAGERDRRDS